MGREVKVGVTEAYQCLAMLARALGPQLEPYVAINLLDKVPDTKLTADLIAALNELASHIPSLVSQIQEQLMASISEILCANFEISEARSTTSISGTSTRTSLLLSLASTSRTPRISMMKSISSPRAPAYEKATKPDNALLILSLKTLTSFRVDNRSLLPLVRDVIVTYLDSDKNEIRSQAAITSAFLLLPQCHQAHPRYHTKEQKDIILEVLERLLIVAITDANVSVRRAVLSSLDSRFDHYLVQPHILKSLLIVLKDRELEIREVVMSIFGRIAACNPAYVMPILRKTVIELLTIGGFGMDSKSKEDSARMLGILIDSSNQLIKPYIPSIVKVLVPFLSDPDSGVQAASLAAIGQLASAGETDMLEYLDFLFPVIVHSLQDKSLNSRRAVTLKVLGQLVQSTGWVVKPYEKFPELLPILINSLKSEQDPAIRLQSMRAVGILGALDPFTFKKLTAKLAAQQDEAPSLLSIDGALADSEQSEGLDKLSLNIALNALVNILKQNSLSNHHNMVVQALVYIFTELGLESAMCLPLVIPPFLAALNSCDTSLREIFFIQLAAISRISMHHMKSYLVPIIELVHSLWEPENPNLLISILNLCKDLSFAVKEDFRVFIPGLIPKMFMAVRLDRTVDRRATLVVLQALEGFGSNLEEYLDLVISPIMDLCESLEMPVEIRKAAIFSVGKLSEELDFTSYTSRIMHPLLQILKSNTPTSLELRPVIMETFCALVTSMRSEVSAFVPIVHKILSKSRTEHSKYRTMLSIVLQDEHSLLFSSERSSGRLTAFDEKSGIRETLSSSGGFSSMTVPGQRITFDEGSLEKAWEITQSSTKEDWLEWMRRFSIELVKSSPSFAIRACQTLAQKHSPLARELFKVAFLSCWLQLQDRRQQSLNKAIKQIFESPSVPAEIIQALLTLSEFLERHDAPLSVSAGTLGDLANANHAYAKALHYKELEFVTQPEKAIQALVSINHELQLPEAALGILTFAQKNLKMELKREWKEKLNQWEDALGAYERQQLSDPTYIEYSLGRMRCLTALGEWERLNELSHKTWMKVAEEPQTQKRMAPMAAAAAWHLGDWYSLGEFSKVLGEEDSEGCFYSAVLNLKAQKFKEGLVLVDKTRYHLSTELGALLGESYSRAYRLIVQLQQLSELEEVVQYRYAPYSRREHILKTWRTRLDGCQRNVEVWQQLLSVRSLVLSPIEDCVTWLKFASLCRKSDRFNISRKVLLNLLGMDPLDLPIDQLPMFYPIVTYAWLKHIWAAGFQKEAFERLKLLALTLDQYPEEVDATIRRKCFLRLASWDLSLRTGDFSNKAAVSEVLQYLKRSTELEPSCYKAQHSLALFNYELISQISQTGSKLNSSHVEGYLLPAIEGFYSSIKLGESRSLQDKLRLLNVMFRYGNIASAQGALERGFDTVSADTWLDVVPQLVARINTSKQSVGSLVFELLSRVAAEHPQALIYPLTVASKSSSSSRKNSASLLLLKIRRHSEKLVEQAEMVSEELIRVAILWPEMWLEAWDTASNAYLNTKDIPFLLENVVPLHEQLIKGPETVKEVQFYQAFARDLNEAYEWIQRYQRNKLESDLNHAWNIYINVYRKVSASLKRMSEVQLQVASPKLLNANDLELAVPGTYKADIPPILIQSFYPSLKVLLSKQRPRKFVLKGSNGKDFPFLLKGHEDLRQDERVMQLFGLVNNLMANNRTTSTKDLEIRRYSAVPLAPNSGVIEWMENTDTVQAQIQEYRDSKKIVADWEKNLMYRILPPTKTTKAGAVGQYDSLTLIQKVDIFDQTLKSSSGQDLNQMLWLKSPNSETWLDRRTNYTRSLAMMSMVGYILGLGDRHVCNIMIDRLNGKLVHIDFGDCFEVAMTRDKYPEKIPFRLTRMLVNAMEVSGIEGNYRSTCEIIMKVLRDNKESVMAVLEAFVHDPLINWRLLTSEPKNEDDASETKNHAEITTGENFNAARKGRAEDEVVGDESEALNERALEVTARVSNKLRGRDFDGGKIELNVPQQVDRLILEAISYENLCQGFMGW
jgi:FKBP12-rapamycin complex-associated protein